MNKSVQNKKFHFKQFTVAGGQCGMPVSTDGVLLGSWIRAENPRNILDIGTGTGLLALMCAQRFPQARITAIDIAPTAIETSLKNVQHSPWKSRIIIQQQDMLTFSSQQNFDVIVCNPPYFSEGKTSQIPARALARHTNSSTHEQWIQQCQSLISAQGRANFILPKTAGKQLLLQAQQHGWYISRRCHVFPTATKPCHRILVELALNKPNHTEETSLTIQEGQQYSPEFTALTKDFYLKM
jgi:tRNA1Val (adenine37-N6)-methyltransferase